MKLNNKSLQNLQQIVENSTALQMLPIVDHDSVKIENYEIFYDKQYKIRQLPSKNIIGLTYTKNAAIAFVKSKIANRDTKEILRLDRVIEKNQQDCNFYRYTIRKTKNKIKQSSTIARYQLSESIMQSAKDELYNIIMD